MENKFEICAYLADALRETRYFDENLQTLEFQPAKNRDDREDHVIVRFKNGRREISINVHADSGIALIRDVLRALEVI